MERHLGSDRFTRFLRNFVDTARPKGRLLYWQEKALSAAGLHLTFEDCLSIFTLCHVHRLPLFRQVVPILRDVLDMTYSLEFGRARAQSFPYSSTERFGSATTNEVDHCPECVRQRELYELQVASTAGTSAPEPMSEVILQNIMDVFQIEGRGTVVTGYTGAAWPLAQRGDEILLRTPDGRTIRTAIKDKELFRKGRLTPEPIPSCGVLLADVIPSDQLPRGTQMLKFRHEEGS